MHSVQYIYKEHNIIHRLKALLDVGDVVDRLVKLFFPPDAVLNPNPDPNPEPDPDPDPEPDPDGRRSAHQCAAWWLRMA
jgi:hypothetical protein